ncbi:MAG TPA: methyltransferase domain-containing protein [Candidatus Competibacteraceae bacterium]|nr:methyltransferase domain-containing protein [Candidatus Competibacteraceae bacterium]HRZ06066.1 methyltransferase domain-containing protein [Candidatus Competibacteraceae bacterium]HSA47466.1 methyltransferase domain-containing protein [Candidatus Competibacteraceae bacterium]
MKNNLPKQITPDLILDVDRFLFEEASAKDSFIIDLILSKIDRDNMSICDIGGASGVILGEIIRRSSRKINGSILDVIDYKNKFSNRYIDLKINFIHSSILDSGISDNQFDIVTFRHVLHHLVGDTPNQSIKLQEQALCEMLRITKHNGYLIFEEEINQVKIFSRLVYYLSKIANRYTIRCKYFQAGICVVSFMNPTEIISTINQISQRQPLEIQHLSYRPWPMSLRWKLTLLMARVGSFFLVVHKK